MNHKHITCGIEHHATLFGLLSKHTFLEIGPSGKEVILEAVTQYGKERGIRMRKNALAHGDIPNEINNQAYGEWSLDYPGQMKFGMNTEGSTVQTYVSKCAWCDAWKKHDLLEYGKYYCDAVDNAVYQGFNPEFTCTLLAKTLSHGGTRCEFDWGGSPSAKDFEVLADKKKELGSSCIQNFNFHTAHLFRTVSHTILSHYGEIGSKIIHNAVNDYCAIFGKEYFNILTNYPPDCF